MTELLHSSTRRGLSGTALKYIACITMLIDHIGASCIEGSFSVVPAALSALDLVLRLIGRLAFPIFCFLLVEGFQHTHDIRRYVSRMFLFGLVSELPFDLAFYRMPFYWAHQNVYWTLALGLLALAGIKHFETDTGASTLKGMLCMLACAVAAELLHTDYGAIGVALIAALYLTRASRKQQCIIGAFMMLYELTAPLAFVLIWFYTGQRGRCSKALQRGFYLFYPVHLALLAGVTNLLL